MNGPGDPPRQTSCCKCWHIIAFLLLTVSFLFLFGWMVKSNADTGLPHKDQKSAQTLLQQIDTNKLRIDLDENVCEEPLCVMCKALIPRSQNISGGSELTCERSLHKNVKNGSCFECNGTCERLADLESNSGGRISCDSRDQEISCCDLSLMGNAGQICGPGGSYNCYGGHHMPVCKCPHGKEGSRCQNDAKMTVNCSCYIYRVCGQEEMIDCENNSNGIETSCHMTVEREGKSYSCICDKQSGRSDSGVDTCSIPNNEPLINDY